MEIYGIQWNIRNFIVCKRWMNLYGFNFSDTVSQRKHIKYSLFMTYWKLVSNHFDPILFHRETLVSSFWRDWFIENFKTTNVNSNQSKIKLILIFIIVIKISICSHLFESQYTRPLVWNKSTWFKKFTLNLHALKVICPS